MIIVRDPEDIYQITGEIQDGSFSGRWHFSFGEYHDREFSRFGTLRVFNDDTLSPGAVWPLHPHRDIEVVTYCAQGEFRHADERGAGGVLKEGWVQHTTVGRGMRHSEINNLKDSPMRFIQMWFFPSEPGLAPSVEQMAVERSARTDKLLLLVSPEGKETLLIRSDSKVYSSHLTSGHMIDFRPGPGRGAYVYPLKGGSLDINGKRVFALGAAMIKAEDTISIKAVGDTELLLVDVRLEGRELNPVQ